MENTPPSTGFLFLDGFENGGDFGVGHRDEIENFAELVFGVLGNAAVQSGDFFFDDVVERDFFLGLDGGVHAFAGAFFDSGELLHEEFLLVGIGDVIAHGGLQNGGDILRGVGQGGVGTGGDAFHALGAVFGDVTRRLAAGDVFAGGRAGAGGHDSERGERTTGLVIAVVGAKFAVEFFERLDGVFFELIFRRMNVGEIFAARNSRRRQNVVRSTGHDGVQPHVGAVFVFDSP